MPVVAGPGQALGGDRAPLGAGARLEHVEEREANRLLQLGVPLDLDVGAIPEVIEVGALLGERARPSRGAAPRPARPPTWSLIAGDERWRDQP